MQNLISGNSQNINEQKSVQIFNASFDVKEIKKGFSILSELESVFNKFDKNQYEILKDDIQRNGINTPIMYLKAGADKIVVDGHIRLNIADELNLNVIPEIELTEAFESMDEVKIWIVKNQCQRRNLSKNQRVRLAYSLKDSIAALAHKNLSLAGSTGSVEIRINTLDEIAKVAGVGRTTVAKYQSVLENGSDEIRLKMVNGQITINNAYEETKNSEPRMPLAMPVETIILKKNYHQIQSLSEGKKMLKSGELNCIMIIQKGNENQVADTDLKIGLLVID